MSRLISIEIIGQSGSYEATVKRIQEQNAKLYLDAQRGTEQMRVNVSLLEQGLSSLQGKLAAAFSVTAIFAYTKHLVDLVGHIQDLSERTGISAQTLSGIRGELAANGIELDQFAIGIQRAQKNLGALDDDGKKAAKALELIGLNAEALKKVSPDEFLRLYTQALSKAENQSQRTAISVAFLGKAGAELNPVMLKLAENLERLRKEGISQSTINAIDDIGDAFTRLKTKMENALIIGFDRLFKISDIAKTTEEVRKAREEIDKLDRLIERNKGAPDFAFGVFSSKETRDTRRQAEALSLAEKRNAALQKFIDLNDKLIRLEQPKPITEPPPIKQKLGIDEKAIRAREQLLEQFTKQASDAAAAFAKLDDPAAAVNIQMAEMVVKIGELKDLTPQQARELLNLVEVVRLYNLAVIEKNREDERQKQLMQDYIAFGKQLEAQKQEELTTEQKLVDLKIKANQHDVDRLRAAGATDKDILRQQIEVLKRNKELLENAPIKTPGEIADITRQIEIAEIQMARLGNTGIDVAAEVGRAVTDITTAVIQGTLKWADVGKSVLASFVRVALDQFATFLKQAQQAAQASNILGGGGAGGGGAMGVAGNILGSLGSGVSTMGNIAGQFGTSIVGRLFGIGSGGFSFGNFVTQLGNLFNPIQLINTLLYSTQLGGMITSLSAVVGNAIASAMSTLTSISWLPYVGWIIAAITAIYRIVANQQERPNVKASAQFSGIGFDPNTLQFTPGAITAGTFDKTGISRSQAIGIASELQQRLTILTDQWVGILNLFPNVLKEQIIPALDITNAQLNASFTRLKFSPGGSRSIQQELQDISGVGGQSRFLGAFLPSLTAGIAASLNRAGIPINQAGLAGGFGQMPPAANQAGFEFLIEQIKKSVNLVSNLARVSPGGVGQFLTPADLDAFTQAFDALFGTRDVQAFSNLATKLEDALKPLTDFLQSAAQQSTDLFGRGLIAAMEAATESDARLAFMNSLGTGIKDVVFQGLSQAFIASAQFGDLLAPIQQQIRIFAQQAITTGQTPDIAAFRAAILPAIEAISTRADLLGPLIDALQELGFNIKDLLRLNPKPAEEPPAPQNAFTINIYPGNISGDADVTDLARRIMNLLEPQLSPRA